jgi:hypothetical protein
MYFTVVGEISRIEVIAKGRGIRSLRELRAAFGGSNWRKMKGIALVELQNGHRRLAEIHWYEAHGIGRKWLKIKRLLD